MSASKICNSCRLEARWMAERPGSVLSEEDAYAWLMARSTEERCCWGERMVRDRLAETGNHEIHR